MSISSADYYYGSKQAIIYPIGVLLLVIIIGVICMPRTEYIGDPMAMRCEAINFINTGRVEVPGQLASTIGEKGQHFFANPINHKWFSKYGIFNDVMYLPPLLLEKIYDRGALPFFPDPKGPETRLVLLNCFNVILSMGSAFYLFLIAARYTSRDWVTVIFVLASLYCTYWWNYLRAQNTEIYQTLFMLGFFYHLTSYFAFDKKAGCMGRGHLVGSGMLLGILILVKTVYVILIPAAALSFLFYELRGCDGASPASAFGQRLSPLRSLVWIGPPVVLALAILLFVNSCKFGSPFETGYGQWEEAHKPIFSGPFFSGVYSLLLSIQGSIFIYYPIIGIALFGFSWFGRNFSPDAFLILSMASLLFFVNAKFLNVLGYWGYGPRYMLIILPLLGLPSIRVFERVMVNWQQWWIKCCSALIVLILGYSLNLQLNVNALPFFSYFRLQGFFAGVHDPAIDRYFISRPFGVIDGDLLAYKRGRPWTVLEQVAAKADPPHLAYSKAFVDRETVSNYYWWP